MIWPFKSKSEKIYDEIKIFKSRLNQQLVPLLEKPEKPIAGNGALISMSINIAMYFLLIRDQKIFEEISGQIVPHAVTSFGSALAMASKGKIGVEDARNFILYQMQTTQENYFNALMKLPVTTEESVQECLDVFLKSGDLTFKDEIERSFAVIFLSEEIASLMKKISSILGGISKKGGVLNV